MEVVHYKGYHIELWEAHWGTEHIELFAITKEFPDYVVTFDNMKGTSWWDTVEEAKYAIDNNLLGKQSVVRKLKKEV